MIGNQKYLLYYNYKSALWHYKGVNFKCYVTLRLKLNDEYRFLITN
jgi:hypothetical protein